MQGCKRFEPEKVMKNDSHARVVRSIIKTAAKRFAVLSTINANSNNNKREIKETVF